MFLNHIQHFIFFDTVPANKRDILGCKQKKKNLSIDVTFA